MEIMLPPRAAKKIKNKISLSLSFYLEKIVYHLKYFNLIPLALVQLCEPEMEIYEPEILFLAGKYVQ